MLWIAGIQLFIALFILVSIDALDDSTNKMCVSMGCCALFLMSMVEIILWIFK